VSRSVRELVETAFAAAEIEGEFDRYVVVDPEFVRPPDPVALVGDPSKARAKLGWVAQTSFDEMIGMMVEEDLRVLSAERERGAAGR
jgi:GDPmannose 4,6-dehydratase